VFKVKREIQQENFFLQTVVTIIRTLFYGWVIKGAAHKKSFLLYSIPCSHYAHW